MVGTDVITACEKTLHQLKCSKWSMNIRTATIESDGRVVDVGDMITMHVVNLCVAMRSQCIEGSRHLVKSLERWKSEKLCG